MQPLTNIRRALTNIPSNFSVKMIRKVAVCSAIALAGAANAFATDRDSGASASGYGAPAPSYGAPEPSYEEPVQEYAAAPSYGAAEAAVPDLTPIIIGILVLTGLSLLFPTYVTLTSVRRKRSAESTQGKSSVSMSFTASHFISDSPHSPPFYSPEYHHTPP